MIVESEPEVRTLGPDGPGGNRGNSRVLHVLGELRAATPERRAQLVARYKAAGLRAEVLDVLAASVSQETGQTIPAGTAHRDPLTYLTSF